MSHSGPALDGAVAFFGEPQGSSPSGSVSRNRIAMALQERSWIGSALQEPCRQAAFPFPLGTLE